MDKTQEYGQTEELYQRKYIDEIWTKHRNIEDIDEIWTKHRNIEELY